MKKLFFIPLIFLLFFNFVSASKHLEAPTLAIYPDIYYPFDEILYLEGKSGPNLTIQVQFQQAGLKPLALNAKSDVNGEWVFTGKVPLEAGNWEVRIRVIQNSGETSSWSNPRIIKVIATGISVGGFTLKYAPMAFIISVLFVAAFVLLMYSIYRVRLVQRLDQEREAREKTEFYEKALKDKEKQMIHEQEMREKEEVLKKELLEKERQAAEMVLEQKFFDLKKDIVQELGHLEAKLSRGGVLDESEEEHRQNLLRRLREIEEEIEKKIKEIK